MRCTIVTGCTAKNIIYRNSSKINYFQEETIRTQSKLCLYIFNDIMNLNQLLKVILIA